MGANVVVEGRSNLSAEQQELVREVLQSMLASSYFSKSKRYPALLEHVVLHTLAGNLDVLKERTIGMEIFGRSADYDPSTDSVVRIAAGEVRKRMALFFSEHPALPVRIDLPFGCYVADFRFQPQPLAKPQPEKARSAEGMIGVGAAQEFSAEKNRTRVSPRVARTALLAFVLVASSVTVFWTFREYRARHDFWWPVAHSGAPALVLLGGDTAPDQTEAVAIAGTPGAAQVPDNHQVMLGNAAAAVFVCSGLRLEGKACKVASARTATMADIRGTSAILIGALDNPWTLQMQSQLPYQFQFSSNSGSGPDKQREILNRSGANLPPWVVKGNDTQFGTDYAVVSRFHSELSGGAVAIVAGITHVGTLGAGEFLSTPGAFDQIVAAAPQGQRGENFEAVLQVEVIQGSPGRISVIAARFW